MNLAFAAIALSSCGGASLKWQAPVTVDSGEGRADAYRLGIADDGHALVLWTRVQNPQPGWRWSSFDGQGGWSPAQALPVSVLPGERLGLSNPTLVMNGAGTAFVVAETENETGRRMAWGARYVRGAGWDNGRVLDDSGRLFCCPTVAVGGVGNAVAVWTLFDATGWSPFEPASGWTAASPVGPAGTPSQRLVLDAVGNGLRVMPGGQVARYLRASGWGPVDAFHAAGGTLGCPAVAMGRSGKAVVVWGNIASADRFSTLASIWAQQFDPTNGWTEPAAIEPTIEDGCSPQVTVDARGNALAVWTRVGQTWYSRLEVGRAWTAPARVAPPGPTPTAGVLAGDDLGNAFLTWTTGDFGVRKAWVTRYERGSGWQSAEPLESGGGDSEVPFLAIAPTGEAVAVWSQTQQGRYTLVTRRYAAN